MKKNIDYTYTPLISIIVPVYNTEDFLSRCIDSILSQTYPCFELLLIDDGSTDGSPEICDNFQKADDRIHVVHKINGGVSSARNIGIEQSKGDYLIFVDSDDYISSHFLIKLLSCNAKVQDDNTFVVTDYQPFNQNVFLNKTKFDSFIADLCPGGLTRDQFHKLVFDFILFPPYSKLYVRKIIEKNHLRFDTELKSAEDFDFNFRYLKHVKKICYFPSYEYYYRVDYKTYIPSNKGVLGHSEIKSLHIMAHGICLLAKRTGIIRDVLSDIYIWAARKYYFNRLPMLFSSNKEVGLFERYKLYRQLNNDRLLKRLYKSGIWYLDNHSTTAILGRYADTFVSWHIFFLFNRLRRMMSNKGRVN